MSTRAIAAEVGVSQDTVMKDIVRSAERSLSPERPDRVTGKDGKVYPAKALAPGETDARTERIIAMQEEGVPVREIAEKELAEKRAVIVQTYRDQGLSQRDIAEKVGVSQTQIALDLQPESDAGEQYCTSASPTFTKGRDGKTYALAEARVERCG